MNDEELKGMVVNNTAVPLQDGVSLDSLFETPKKDTSEEMVSSSSVSPAELSDPVRMAQNILDSFKEEKEKEDTINDSTASIDSNFPDLGFQKEEEEVSIPEVTIENPNQDDDNEMEDSSFHDFSAPIQNSEMPFEENPNTFSQVNDMNLVNDGAVSTQNVDMELPQVTIENPNQDMENMVNEVTSPEMGIPIQEDISDMPIEQNSTFSPIMSEQANDMNTNGMEQINEIPMVPIEEENNDMDAMMVNKTPASLLEEDASDSSVNPDDSFAPIETNMLFDQALQPSVENIDSNMVNQDINENSMEVAEVVSPQMDIQDVNVQTAPIYSDIPNMQANPNVEPISIDLSGDVNNAEEYQETPNYVMQNEVSKSQEEIDLEKRNGSGIRFIIIFGLIILIFIILLPYISELI